MARRAVAVAILFLTLLTTAFGDQPKVLIVQHHVDKVKDVDINVDITDYVAQAFDDDGRVTSIVWSDTDPVYRAALDSGKIKPGHEKLSHSEAVAAEHTMGCDYLLVVEAKSQGAGIMVRGELFRGDRKVWQDPDPSGGLGATQNRIEELYKDGKISKADYEATRAESGYRKVAISIQGKFTISGTSRSIARTWTMLLQTSAFRGLESRNKLRAPDISPGQVPKVLQSPVALDPKQGVDPVKARAAANEQLFASVAAAVKANRTQDAVLILREAVDQSPLDLDRRRALVKVLTDGGYNDLAAQEAVRASHVVPDKGAFKLEGAQAAVASGQYDLAQTQALEVLAKEPESAAAQCVLGEVALLRADYPGALERLNTSVSKGASPEAYGYRAFARALTGDGNGAVEDWNVSVKSGPQYALWVPVMNSAAPRQFDALKALFPRIAAKAPQDPQTTAAILDTVKSLRASVEATAKLLATIVPPKEHSKSHARRVLAYQLLAQSLSGVESVVQKPDDDAMSDARINFGEALKQWDAALALAKSE